MADVVVVVILVVVVALAVRSLRREGLSCGGDCATCAGGCKAPHIRLSHSQRRQLRELRRKGGGAA